MKLKRILLSPYITLLAFFLILISGDQRGGFYFQYLLMALPHAGLHFIFAVIGALLLLYSYHRFNRKFITLTEPVLNIIGTFLLFASLLYFFFQPGGSHNWNTFAELLPLLTLFTFFSLSALLVCLSVTGRKLYRK